MVAAAAPRVQPTPLRILLLPMLAVVGAVMVALPSPSRPMVPVLLGIAFGSVVLIPNGRGWAVAPLLVTELTLESYFIGQLGVSMRLATVLLGAAVLGGAILTRTGLADCLCRRVLLPGLVLITVATAVNWMFSEPDYVIKYLRYQVAQLLTILVVIAALRSRQDVKRAAIISLVLGIAVGAVAIMQHYAPESALYGAAEVSDLNGWKGRVLGLATTPVGLANQMAFVLMPLLGVLICGPWRRDRTRIALWICAAIIAGGLNFTYTRSAVFTVAPGLVLMALYMRGRARALLLGAVVAAFFMFQMLEGTGLIGSRYYKDASEDRSAASHQALWDVAFAVALDNPIVGIGHEHFEAISIEYMEAVESDAKVMGGADSVGQERPHNDFLSVWLSWGIVALIAYLALFLGALRNYWAASKHPDPLIRGLAVGCAGGLALYAVNSAYHNYLDSTTVLWMYAGFSVVLARLTARPCPPRPLPAQNWSQGPLPTQPRASSAWS